MSSDIAREYFEFIAEMGLTKHGGSMQATRQLVELCHIGEDSYVLDVGCGVGATPAYLAKEIGCRVMGVDLLEKMVEQSRKRAKSDGLEDRTEFRAADARELPFEDNLFDAVISESVNAFFDEKDQAMREYVRVTKPGGYVGTTEATWLKPPTPEMDDSLRDIAYLIPMEAQGWQDLMKAAGLVDVVGSAHKVEISVESKGRFERYGWRRIMTVLPKTLLMLLTDKNSRRFMRSGVGAVSQGMMEVMGYGVFAGRKP